jgi:hypothetical protein
MARKVIVAAKLRKTMEWTAIVAAVAFPVTFAGSSVFGTFTVNLDRRENFADITLRKALADDVKQPASLNPEALLAKPLFVSTRQPFKFEIPVPGVAAPGPIELPQLPHYRVGGVMISPQSSKVLLRVPNVDGGRWLSEGDLTPEGWSVASIKGNQVLLARGEQTIGFNLYESR